MFKKFTFVAFGGIASIAVALVILTAAPAAQAGWASILVDAGKVAVKDTAKDAAKAGADRAEATATGAKMENNVGGLHATGVEANGMKVENTLGGSHDGGGDDPAPVWFKVLCVVGVCSWLLWKLQKFLGKRA